MQSAKQFRYARRSTCRNTMVVGVQDPKCFQLSLNESSAGAKTRQDPLTIPYFGRTGVLCIPHCIFVAGQPASVRKPLMPSMLVQMPSMGYRNQYRRAEMGGCYYEPALSLPVLQAVQALPSVDFYVMLHASEDMGTDGVFSLLYHTWVFGSDCNPNLNQTANIEVACFGVDKMHKRRISSDLEKSSLPVGKPETRGITLTEGRFHIGSTLVPHAAMAADTQRPFFSFYALASTTHGSPSHAPQKRAVLTFHVVLLATHLKQTARALCANSRTLETLLAECRVRLPILELSISHIATAFSASVRMDDQAASRAPVTTADERDTTQRALALSDLSSSTALVDSKTISTSSPSGGPGCATWTSTAPLRNQSVRVPSALQKQQSRRSISPWLSQHHVRPAYDRVWAPPMSPHPTVQTWTRSELLLWMVGRVDRELSRHREDRQRQLEARLSDQKRALGRLAEDLDGQRGGIQSLLKLVAEQNAIIQEFRQASTVEGSLRNSSKQGLFERHDRKLGAKYDSIWRRRTLDVVMPTHELFSASTRRPARGFALGNTWSV